MNKAAMSIGNPPQEVAQSFRPVGEWQLHLVRERISFRCVLCGEQRKGVLWAATRYDSTQELACQPCYRGILREHYSMEPDASQSGPKPSKEELARQRSQRLAYERWHRRLPGVDGVISFFRSAGVTAELLPDGRLRVNGEETRPLPHILPPPGTIDWSEVIDEMAIRYASDKFIRAVSDNGRFGEGLRAFLRKSDMGFAIMHHAMRLGLIRATRAYVPGRDVIVANFLSPGSHWHTLADLIHDAEPALTAEHDREHATEAAPDAPGGGGSRLAAQPTVRSIQRLPDYVPAELRAACIEASRRLRLERQVAYDRPVVLICSIGELTLLPVIENDRGFSLPFQLAFGSGTIRAQLVLADRDPLPLEIREDVALEDAVIGWTNALIGFADVTCIHLHSPAMRAPHEHRPTASSAASVPSPRRTSRIRHGGHPWPSHLVPVGRWARYSGSLVAGHRRRLTAGRTASDEAHQRARQVGITLRPGETWVRPHARGIPEALEMRFQWHRPDELSLHMPVPRAASEATT
jgi:hypothetical protein